MEKEGIVFEDVKMKLLMYSLDEDPRFCERLYPPGALF